MLTVTGDVHDAARAGRMGSTVLPVHEIDTGGDTEAYGLDEAAAATMVAQRLPGAALPVPPGGRLKVLVQNGVGTPGLGERARRAWSRPGTATSVAATSTASASRPRRCSSATAPRPAAGAAWRWRRRWGCPGRRCGSARARRPSRTSSWCWARTSRGTERAWDDRVLHPICSPLSKESL
nr:hypothetical protein [Angustibacter aerolatus]